MTSQFWSVGQHSAAVMDEFLVLMCKHVVPAEQQKFGGKSLGHWLREGSLEHVAVSCLGWRVRLAFGSNSSGIHNTLAEPEGRRYENARQNADMRCRVKGIITIIETEFRYQP